MRTMQVLWTDWLNCSLMDFKRADAAKKAWSKADGPHCSNSQSASLTEISPDMNTQNMKTQKN